MSKKTYQRYTAEFKAQALALVAAGQPVAAVAQDLCVSSNLIYEWRSGRPAGFAARKRPPPGQNDILKKAAIIFGSKPRASSAP